MWVYNVMVWLALNICVVQACLPEGVNNEVEIGKETYVCAVINNQEVALFTPVADEYSRFVIPNSFANASSCDPFYFPSKTCEAPCNPPLLSIWSMGVKAVYQKAYAECPPDGSGSLFYPLQTAIISVDMGVVTSVSWDDGCFSCSSNSASCTPNAYNYTGGPVHVADGGEDCGIPRSKCMESDSSSCDLVVYVVWRGRDKNGNYFGSAVARVSNFARSLASMGADDEFDPSVAANQTLTQVDSYISTLPRAVVVAVAVLCLFLSILLAFFGAKYESISAFVSGATIGTVFGSILAANIFQGVGNRQVMFTLIGCIVAFGILGLCLAAWIRLLFSIALSITILAFLVQDGIIRWIGIEWVSYLILAVVGILAFIIGMKMHEHLQLVVCTSVAACLFSISLSRLIGGGISVVAIFVDPTSVGCGKDWKCWACQVGALSLLATALLYHHCANLSDRNKAEKKVVPAQRKRKIGSKPKRRIRQLNVSNTSKIGSSFQPQEHNSKEVLSAFV